jgi:hypothetical protein
LPYLPDKEKTAEPMAYVSAGPRTCGRDRARVP